MTIEQLEELGFDRSAKDGRYLKVRCSQCEALVIMGTPCHETGCPNANPKRDNEREDDDDTE